MNTPAAVEYRDRTAGLIVFGVLEILLGALFLLMVPLMLLSLAMAGRQTGVPPSPQVLIPATGLYALAGAILIWLGVGSILGRRWARALWVCLSGIGLGTGVMAIPFALYVFSDLPRTMAASGQPPLPPAAILVTQIVTAAFMLLFYIVIPGVLFLFYRSPHVKHTCETRDLKERWTDRCPLPVLALSLFTTFGGFGVLFLLAYRCVFPLFGILLTGAAGCIVILVVAGTMLYLGWGLYRLKIQAWRLLLAVIIVLTLSGAITFWRTDLSALYLTMGFDSQTVAMTAQMGQMTAIKWMGFVYVLPWIVWMLLVRRCFPKASPAAGGPA